jgi:hypothetical protein
VRKQQQPPIIVPTQTNAFQALFNTTTVLANNPQINQGVTTAFIQNNFDNLIILFLGLISLILLIIFGPWQKKIIMDKYNDIYSLKTDGTHLMNLKKFFFFLLLILQLIFFGLLPFIGCIQEGTCLEIFAANYKICLICPALTIFQKIPIEQVFISPQNHKNTKKKSSKPSSPKNNQSNMIIITRQLILGFFWIIPVSIFSSHFFTQ